MTSTDIIDAAHVGALTEISIIIALAAMLLLPGYAFLAVSTFGKGWSRFSRFALAICLSVAFYPVLFYNLRFWLPGVVLNGWILLGLLAFCGLVIVVVQSKEGWPKLQPSLLGVVAFFVVGITLLTRLWVAHLYPVPAWTDSLHHVLLTQLTAEQGQLASSLEPYFPINLTMYHLGLYALSASVEWLTDAASHLSLQWTAQVLNGLCGLGVYLVLEPRVGKVGAIGGMVTVGLLAHQPAYYVNWGRYTQIASQTVLLAGWAVVLHGMESLLSPDSGSEERKGLQFKWLWFENVLIVGLLSAGLFLLHFRVAALYIALLLASVPWYLFKAYRANQLGRMTSYLAAIALIAILFIFPTLWQALEAYTSLDQNKPVITDAQAVENAVNSYYVFPWASIPLLSARTWLLIVAAVCALIGLLCRNRLVIMALVWSILIIGIGNAYLLDINVLKVTNLGTILIMLYLPIGLIIGVAIGEVDRFIRTRETIQETLYQRIQVSLIALLVIAGLYGGWKRINEIEFGRFFVQEQDLAAMAWIAENTPTDSLFAVNTIFWLPGTPHGIDAGYWIPYITGRQMTVGPMLMVLAPYEYRIDVIEKSRGVVDLEENVDALDALREEGVDYIFVGALSQQTGAGLSVDLLQQSEQVDEVFALEGSSVFRLQQE